MTEGLRACRERAGFAAAPLTGRSSRPCRCARFRERSVWLLWPSCRPRRRPPEANSGHRHAGVRPGGSGASHADDASATPRERVVVNAVLKPVEIHAQQTR